MRNKVAKKLKKEVALKMYVGGGVTAEQVMEDSKSVYSSSDFKSVYRSRKKRYTNPSYHQVVVHHPTKPNVKFTGKARLGRMKKEKTHLP